MSTKHVLNLYESLILSHNIGFIMHGRKSIISIAVYGPSKLFSYKLEASHKLTHPSIASKMQSKSKHIIHSTTPRKLKCKRILIKIDWVLLDYSWGYACSKLTCTLVFRRIHQYLQYRLHFQIRIQNPWGLYLYGCLRFLLPAKWNAVNQGILEGN